MTGFAILQECTVTGRLNYVRIYGNSSMLGSAVTRRERVDDLAADLERLVQGGSSADGIAWRWGLMGVGVDDLRHARRQFAMAGGHPDLARTPDERAEATRKIARVNAIIDRAIREARG
jgi:hypothetical protein